jgi:hypothetical protein
MLAVALEGGDPDGRVNVANIADFVPVIHERDPMIAAYGGLPDPRIFRNERPNYPERYPRTLFIVRDPRATLVSYFHYYTTLSRDTDMSMDEFVRRYLTDGCIASFEPRILRWDVMAQQWLTRGGQQPVMTVKYEELHDERLTVFTDVVRFCGLSDDAAIIASSVERGRFMAMKREEGRYGVEPQHPPDPPSRGWFFREGRTDGWKHELSPLSLSAIERAFAPTMDALGYGAVS